MAGSAPLSVTRDGAVKRPAGWRSTTSMASRAPAATNWIGSGCSAALITSTPRRASTAVHSCSGSAPACPGTSPPANSNSQASQCSLQFRNDNDEAADRRRAGRDIALLATGKRLLRGRSSSRRGCALGPGAAGLLAVLLGLGRLGAVDLAVVRLG